MISLADEKNITVYKYCLDRFEAEATYNEAQNLIFSTIFGDKAMQAAVDIIQKHRGAGDTAASWELAKAEMKKVLEAEDLI